MGKDSQHSQCLDGMEFKATIIKIYQHVGANILKMHEKMKMSQERNMRPKEEPKGNLRIQNTIAKYKSHWMGSVAEWRRQRSQLQYRSIEIIKYEQYREKG